MNMRADGLDGIFSHLGQIKYTLPAPCKHIGVSDV